MLLINNDIEKKSNIYELKKHKSKKFFIIPALFLKYINSNTLEIQIKINYNNEVILNKDEIINIYCNSCRIIDDFGFYFFLRENGGVVDVDQLNKYALLE